MAFNEEENVLNVKEFCLNRTSDGDYKLELKVSEKFINFILAKINFCRTDNKNTDIKLTTREKEVLKILLTGKKNIEIAKELILSVHTVKAHVSKIFSKLSVADRVQAAVKATSENLLDS